MRHRDGTAAVGGVHGLHLGIRLQLRGIACGIAGVHVFNIRQPIVRKGQGRGGNRVGKCVVVRVTCAIRKCIDIRHRAFAARHRRRVVALQNACQRRAAGVCHRRESRSNDLRGAGHCGAARVRRDGEVRHVQRDRLCHRCRHTTGVGHRVCSGESLRTVAAHCAVAV